MSAENDPDIIQAIDPDSNERFIQENREAKVWGKSLKLKGSR